MPEGLLPETFHEISRGCDRAWRVVIAFLQDKYTSSCVVCKLIGQGILDNLDGCLLPISDQLKMKSTMMGHVPWLS